MKITRHAKIMKLTLVSLAAWTLTTTCFGQVYSYWNLSEVFSSANGSIQFVELSTTLSSHQTLGAYELVNDRGQQFFFQMPYIGGGGNYTFLLATPGFAGLPGAVPPDVSWLPAGFLSPGSGALHLQPYGARNDGTYGGLFDSGYLSWSHLYINGTDSIGPDGVNPINSPENHAGQVGLIMVPEPSSASLLTLMCVITGTSLFVTRRKQKQQSARIIRTVQIGRP